MDKETEKHPGAVLYLDNGKKIVLELLPGSAPNTVNSFIWAAGRGIFDHHHIERIVPGDWVDVSYTGFGKKEGQYLIPWEYELHPQEAPLVPSFGYVCMGGYGKMGEAGCEFFFPLRDCPEQKGVFPVFGRVVEGLEELRRLENLDLIPVTDYPDPKIVVNRPRVPQEIVRVELMLHGAVYPEPERMPGEEIPECWKMVKLR